ncbi:hypothetical protein [Rhizobium sophorae]|uniref:hypothetical protein n=1 Tax=Rhizobium sophorae TaxID=1535242 RepID=UPI001FE926CB|nr:hypothetical protein [Rhizobium sophorae]
MHAVEGVHDNVIADYDIASDRPGTEEVPVVCTRVRFDGNWTILASGTVDRFPRNLAPQLTIRWRQVRPRMSFNSDRANIGSAVAFKILNPIAIFDQQVTGVWPRRTDCEGPSPEAHTSDENVLAIVEIDRGGSAILEIQILDDDPLAVPQNQRRVISKEVDAWKRSSLLMCGRQLVGFALITLKIKIGPDFCFRPANGNWLGLRTTFAIDGDWVMEATFIQMNFATWL